MIRTTRRELSRLALALPALTLLPSGAQADDTVRIGAIYPLSGGAQSAGASAKQAIEVAVEIINNAHLELPKLPLAPTVGLPNLGGRKVEVVFADHQGNPDIAKSETTRLINQEKVVAMVGAYQSSCSLTSSWAAERYGIPFMASEASAASLTARGFKWLFRPTPIGTHFAKAYADFMVDMRATGWKIGKIAVVHEIEKPRMLSIKNPETGEVIQVPVATPPNYGSPNVDEIVKGAADAGLKIGLRIPFYANDINVGSQVLQLKNENPDVVIFLGLISNSILFMKTMHNLGYTPPMLIGDYIGFSDTNFIDAVGDLAEGVINRSSFDIGKPGTNSFIVNELYTKHAGHALDDTSARAMQGFLALADAINRAGSTEPAKLQAALIATDLKPDQLMIGYNGIRYDETGQNKLASTLLVQLIKKHYVPVWPASMATMAPQMPFKGWS
jgi:branched-chain amino acid transport system substrate-binding protein